MSVPEHVSLWDFQLACFRGKLDLRLIYVPSLNVDRDSCLMPPVCMQTTSIAQDRNDQFSLLRRYLTQCRLTDKYYLAAAARVNKSQMRLPTQAMCLEGYLRGFYRV